MRPATSWAFVALFPSRPIALVGFMAAGKSTIGRLLACELQLPFLDSDREIERSIGCTIPTVFRDQGEPEFRRLEREVIARIAVPEPQVIAIGGGAFCDAQTREILNRRAITIWLDAPFDVMLARLLASNGRPLVRDRTAGDIRELWDERRPFYKQAQLHVATGDSSPGAVVEQILEAIR